MPNYKEMYYTLFRAQLKAKAILEDAEIKAEAMYIESEEPVKLIDSGKKSNNEDDG
ncbi:MAG: hypothetical protein ACK5LX_14155 [Oscillospiraceae bacterium]